VNVSAAEATWPIIEAQGFRRFCNGAFAAIPLFGRRAIKGKVTAINAFSRDDHRLQLKEWHILSDHERYGCISVCCETMEGSYPFVFRRRLFRRHPLPCAQLIYCADQGDFERCAKLLGRFLASRGMPWVLVAGDGPMVDIPGRYFPNKMPMYFLGTRPKHPGDLAYTEAALFGL